MTALKQLIIKNITWRTLNYTSVLLLNIAIARIFGASMSGEINLIITAFSFFLLIGSLTLDSALTYMSLREAVNIHRLATTALLWGGAASTLILFSLSFSTELNNSIGYRIDLLFCLAYFSGNLLTAFFSALFYGQQNFWISNLVCFSCNALLITILVFASLLRLEPAPVLFLKIYFMIILVQGILIAFFFLNNYQIRWQLPCFKELKLILNYIIFTFITSVLIFLLHRLDYWFLLKLNKSPSKMVEIGNYIQVSKLVFSFQIFSSMLGSAVFSSTAFKRTTSDSPALGRLIRYSIYVGITVFSVFFFAGEFLFAQLFGPSFSLMNLPFLIMLPGAVMLMSVSITANYLAGVGKVRYNMYGVLLAIIVISAIDVLLIPRFGMVAAALGSTMAYIVYGSFLLFYFAKFNKGGLKEVYNMNQDITQLISFVQKKRLS